MNNAQGARLLERVRPGSLVTIRTADGRQVTGRAHKVPTGFYRLRVPGETFGDPLTAENVTQVRDI